ncbi:D-ribose pyranase [Planosporangium thailandense]|uniref:D-ribose pyranase n=1 Tax=Planosporangium thailandense TaxID=765197 RepID=A0ABX0XRS8_9ACTN|nr:D-ribose pyranase [Planosporangium thailandense]NJC68602.1 D-ribose pyranase [Planosporangium thailandense]
MRRSGTLNGQLARIMTEVGHTDRIVVADAGLPIPGEVERVDLAVRENLPRFLDVLDTVLEELAVEGAVLAEEIKQASPEMFEQIRRRLAARGVTPEFVPHTEFKTATGDARAAVRTGEFTPYANVILVAGVVF